MRMSRRLLLDFVIATGECHTVREFLERSFKIIGITLIWTGEKGTTEELGVNQANPEQVLVRIDPKYFRPTEVDILIGDPAKAKKLLGWTPTTLFEDLVTEMTQADIQILKEGNATD